MHADPSMQRTETLDMFHSRLNIYNMRRQAGIIHRRTRNSTVCVLEIRDALETAGLPSRLQCRARRLDKAAARSSPRCSSRPAQVVQSYYDAVQPPLCSNPFIKQSLHVEVRDGRILGLLQRYLISARL